MAPLKIKLHGRHRLERVPEIGVVKITAKSTFLSKEITVNEIQRTSQKLYEMIAPLTILTEDGDPDSDAAILDWNMSPMHCHASQYFPDPRARSTQAGTQARTQASPLARTQVRTQASTQTSPLARTQASTHASSQTRTHVYVGSIGQASTQASLQTPRDSICRVHSASIGLEVTFGNFTKLREFMDQVVEIPNVSIDEVRWDLSKASHELADAEVRKMALLNALSLAEDYATSLGHDMIPVEIRPRRVKVENPKEKVPVQARSLGIIPQHVETVPRKIVFTNKVKVIFGPA